MGCSIEVKFLGGLDAWSGADEDICDADVLDRKVRDKTKMLLGEYGESHNLNICFFTGEKAWSYIDLDPLR